MHRTAGTALMTLAVAACAAPEAGLPPQDRLGLRLGFSNVQTHFEGSFAWAVVDTDIQLTTPDGRDIHNRGHGTYLFRWVDGAWKVVHTQSASSPVRRTEPGGA